MAIIMQTGHRADTDEHFWTYQSDQGPTQTLLEHPPPSGTGHERTDRQLGAVNKPEMQVSGVRKPEKPRYLGGSGIRVRARNST